MCTSESLRVTRPTPGLQINLLSIHKVQSFVIFVRIRAILYHQLSTVSIGITQLTCEVLLSVETKGLKIIPSYPTV